MIACDFDPQCCLFALGCYAGGDSYMTDMSTSMYDVTSQLALPREPVNASKRCLTQVVALPYWIPGSKHHTDQARLEYEDTCLRQLHTVLLHAKLAGKAIRALLLEYILSGNGGELSERFLLNLARLLKAYDVVVIADEVMTGGRVGPHMTMTTSMPAKFRERVHYITIGKFMKAAIVLKKSPPKPQQEEPKRGTSTWHEAGLASYIFALVQKRMKERVFQKRQQYVLNQMKVKHNPELYWGRGLLLFIGRVRWQEQKGLKCRLLPLMEENVKLRIGSTRPGRWTRSKVTEHLRAGAENWIKAQVRLCGWVF